MEELKHKVWTEINNNMWKFVDHQVDYELIRRIDKPSEGKIWRNINGEIIFGGVYNKLKQK